MQQDGTVAREAQAVTYERLERFVRGKAQELIQENSATAPTVPAGGDR
jgi:hypothetical protein